MKTLYKTIKFALGVFVIAALAVSCLPEQETMGDAGQTLIKLTPTDGFSVTALSPVNTAQSLPLFEVRRDVHSEAALNSQTTVELLFDTDNSVLTAYNTENETEFVTLPTTLHTTVPALTGGKMTITFAPGENIKTVMINVPNAFNFDFSKQYALAYKIGAVTGTGKLSEAASTEIVCQVLAKNKYDGIYEVTANSPMLDVANAALTGYYPFKYKLITTGEHTVDVYEFDNDYPLHPISNAGAWSYYGSFGIMMGFAPAGDGTITSFSNIFGTPANTRAAVIDPSGVNKWDPATKNILIKYWMKQPSVITDPPNIRTYFDETWKYLGPR
jgi:hypothetical protein